MDNMIVILATSSNHNGKESLRLGKIILRLELLQNANCKNGRKTKEKTSWADWLSWLFNSNQNKLIKNLLSKSTQLNNEVIINEVVLSALPARLRIDDTQAYIRMDCKRGNPVSALGVGGIGLWTKIIVAHTLKWPSGLVCLATCIKNLFLLFGFCFYYLVDNSGRPFGTSLMTMVFFLGPDSLFHANRCKAQRGTSAL